MFACFFFFEIGPLVTDLTSIFTITPPTSSSNRDLNPTNSFICESASRILFQTIDWIKSNSCFQTLEYVCSSKTKNIFHLTYF